MRGSQFLAALQNQMSFRNFTVWKDTMTQHCHITHQNPRRQRAVDTGAAMDASDNTTAAGPTADVAEIIRLNKEGMGKKKIARALSVPTPRWFMPCSPPTA